jgi:UDP-3-O-[3-hydroxymyristoyl] glucosamine N-acyltransferase
MKLSEPTPAQVLADLSGAEYFGPADLQIHGINEIHKITDGDLTFADHPNFYPRAFGSDAAVVLVDKAPADPAPKPYMIAKDPFRAFNSLLRRFAPRQAIETAISPHAVIGEGSVVEHGAVVGPEVIMGRNCYIHSGAILKGPVILGNGVEIHPHAVIGGDAFYYKTRVGDKQRSYEKMHSSGRVIIGDQVEIGAACTIDRGGTGDTILGKGTKLDNQVHIGHGSIIGEHCLFAAQCGIGGKVIIGDRVVMWGQVGVSKDLTIGDDTMIYAQSGVKDSLPGGKVWFGSPVREARDKMKELAASKDLYSIWMHMRDRI